MTTLSADRFEQNDTAGTATDLRTLSGALSETGLSIETNDPDWFAFTLAAAGRYGDTLSIDFTHALGDLDLRLYDSTGATVLGSSTGVGNTESISLDGLAAGSYRFAVYGYSGASNPDYDLSLYATPAQASGDRFEQNDTAGTATDLRTLSGALSETGLSIETNDPDWFAFTLAAAGRYGDTLSIDFTHALGDLDLRLYDSTGATVLGSSTGVGNSESISLDGLAAGSYRFAVYGYSGASNPDYDLSLYATPAQASGDRFEQNDTAATATDLRTLSGALSETGLSIETNDPDWFAFTLAAAGRYGDTLSIDFTHALGDLDLRLYDSTGATVLGSSTGVGNSESISLDGLAAGSYRFAVYGYSGASNPDYDLSLYATPAQASGDRFEQNDTAGTATDLRTLSGALSETGLSIETNDPDWFAFTLAAAGRYGDTLSIDFTHALGDLDLRLYDSTGATVLGSSTGVGNSESISLDGLAAGSYRFAVYGYSGASNPDYDLSLYATPAQASGDRFEQNDTAATATDLRTLSGALSETGLSIETNDPDWFAFTLAAAGRYGDTLSIDFTHALGDLDLRLYDSTGATVLGSSTGVGNSESISLDGLAAGSYRFAVYGYSGASNPDYDLSLYATPAQASGDRFEQNDTAGTATDLRTLSGALSETGLSIETNDPDWFAFTLAAAGRYGDTLSIDFTHALGDLDLRLYDSTGATVLGSSTGVGNSESISLDGLAAGSYRFAVYGYSGASNPTYDLTLNATPAQASGDRFEQNDSVATATDLRTLSGALSETGLSIETNDPDWFAFTLAAAGRYGDTLSIDFTHALGDLDLRLYDSTGATVLGSSTGVGNSESISLDGLAAGSYRFQVYGYGGASNPNYDLTASIQQAAQTNPDSWESNNSRATATIIRDTSQTISGASITANDRDWFRFDLSARGGEGDFVNLSTFGNNVHITLYGANGTAITSATSSGNFSATLLPLQNLAAGAYYVEVQGISSDTLANYDLEISTQAQNPSSPGGGGGTAGTWTILVYGDGDNNLEAALIDDINEMELANPGAQVNIGIMTDRIGGYDGSNGNWTDTRRGVITHDSNSTMINSNLVSIGEVNTGDPATLTSFINWGVSALPAEHYAIVIWDHGGGLSGSAWDDSNSHDNLSLSEVSTAIQGSSLASQGVDLLGFDACLMASIEQLHEAAGYADQLVFSELTEPGDGWDYTTFLNQFSSSDHSLSALSSSIVEAYGSFYGPSQTLSAFASANLAALRTAVDGFANLMLSSGTSTDWQAVASARQQTLTADSGYESLIDLGSFMGYVSQSSTNASLRTAAQSVINALQSALVEKGGNPGYSGLTINFPLSASGLTGYNATTYSFLRDTRWDDFLSSYYTRTGARLPESVSTDLEGARAEQTADTRSGYSADFAETLNLSGIATGFSSNNNLATSADLGIINRADFRIANLNIHTTGDVDWFRFSLSGQATGNASIIIGSTTTGEALQASLYDENQNLLTQSSSGASVSISAANRQAGQYFLKVETSGGATNAGYSILMQNLIGAGGDAMPDFAENSGGNNAINKAWSLGGPAPLEAIGALENLTYDDLDVSSGAQGGDWFRVDSSRVTESNANHVVLDNALEGNLDLYVYDITGALLTQAVTGNTTEEAWFSSQVDDIFIQVVSRTGEQNSGYTLTIENAESSVLPGTAGNDIITSLAGNDTLDGAAGTDTAVFTGNRSAYTITRTSTGYTVSGSADGTDTLTSIERARFADQTLDLAPLSDYGTRLQVFATAWLDRQLTPEELILYAADYAQVAASGGNIYDTDLHAFFLANDADNFLDNPDPADMITDMYERLTGTRDVPQEMLDTFIDRLENNWRGPYVLAVKMIKAGGFWVNTDGSYGVPANFRTTSGMDYADETNADLPALQAQLADDLPFVIPDDADDALVLVGVAV